MNLTINNPSLDNDVLCPNNSLSYFDLISQKLDNWQAKRLAQLEQRAQLVKTLLVKDTDSLTGITKTFRITTELIATEQADVNALELPEQALTESEANSYVS
jgi:hypothetical protein